MQNSKKWSIIALASVVFVSVAYFGSTGKLSGLKSNVLMTEPVNMCQPESLPFYPDYKQAIYQRDMIQADITTVKQKIEEAQGNVKIFQEKTQTLAEQNKKHTSQIADLTKANKTLCVKPSQIKQCSSNRTRITELQNKIKYNEKNIVEFKNKIADTEKSLTEYKEQYTKLDNSRLEIIAQIDNFEKRIEEACKPPVISGEVGFRMATWECHDETQARYKDMHSCTDVQTWKSFSEVSCQNKCSKETGKCGVNRLVYDETCDIQIPSVCGNGIREGSEQCDDGNVVNGDKCSAQCTQESNDINYLQAANKLASLGVIVDNSANPAQYRLEDKLIRQEAIKVAAGVHGGILQQEPGYVCKNMFTDVQNGTWVCRIAELSRTAGLLDNDINTFRPTENLSLLEALDFSLRASKLMPAGKHTATEVFWFAVDAGLIPSAYGLAPDFPTTRGAYFYYLVKAMKAAEQPDLCEIAPDLCSSQICGNDKKEGTEQCDDGNTKNGDGCDSLCKIENIATQCESLQGSTLCLKQAGCYYNEKTSKCTSEALKCEEVSDAQDDIFTKGMIWWFARHVYSPRYYQASYDYCTGNSINQVSCDSEGFAKYTTVACPNGCSDGACSATVPVVTATVSQSTLSPKSSLFLAGSRDQKIFAFNLKAESDNVKINSITFSGVNLDNLSNYRLLTPTGVQVMATNSTIDSVNFVNVSVQDTVLKGKTDIYYLIADINTNVNGANFGNTLLTSTVKVKKSDGLIVPVSGDVALGESHIITENKAVISKSSNASKSLTTSALRFVVSVAGKDSVTLNAIKLDNKLSGYLSTDAKIVVYKNSISAANKVGQTSTGVTTGTVTLASNNIIDAGVSVTYIVVIEGILPGPTSTNQDWSVSLTNANFNSGNFSVVASDYANIGAFPITEVK